MLYSQALPVANVKPLCSTEHTSFASVPLLLKIHSLQAQSNPHITKQACLPQVTIYLLRTVPAIPVHLDVNYMPDHSFQNGFCIYPTEVLQPSEMLFQDKSHKPLTLHRIVSLSRPVFVC